MKKVLMVLTALVIGLNGTFVFAETAPQQKPMTTTNPTTIANFNDQAKDICSKKGLEGKWLDECVKTEAEKLAKAAQPKN